MAFVRGRLAPPGAAPAQGENLTRLADLRHAAVDQILSGRLDGPVDYCEDEDEWVVVLHGAATLVVDDEQMELGPGDWVLLPARTPHRLVETRPETSWLTVTSPAPATPT
ncbi:MAG TPA: cupin domain-containing protein [Acidimicrobiales bacterium]|jgi:cupin 2 domain-containing protein